MARNVLSESRVNFDARHAPGNEGKSISKLSPGQVGNPILFT